jgi:uncharacterized membrane protein
MFLFSTGPVGESRAKRSVDAFSSERPLRSLAKAVSWRVTGSLDTTLLSWLFTGDLTIAAAIGLTEVCTKMVLYYLHERAWNRISLGRTKNPARQQHEKRNADVSLDRNLRPAAESES